MPQKAPKPVPDEMHTLTTHLWFNGQCRAAIDFYKKAFGVELVGNIAFGPDGKTVLHAMLRIGDSNLMVADAFPGSWEKAPAGSATAGLWVYVEDCDALYHQAVNAGCEVITEVMDAFWGDRMGKVKDPYGHCWAFATRKWVVTEDEFRQGQEAWLASMKQ